MQSEIKEAKEFYHQNNKLIDYISLTLDKKINWAIYTNDVVKRDDAALKFLHSNSQWKFLIENDLILFYTTKNGKDILFSYEYKLKKLSKEHFNDFIKNLENPDEKNAVEYFSCERRIGEYTNGGVWFFGLEQKKDSVENILKVYFKAFYENENGESLFDENFGGLIENCGISAMKTIMQEIYPLLQYGFQLYMVGWNYDFVTKTSKYKVYCRVGKNCNKIKFFNEIEKKFSALNIDLNEFEENQGLHLQGFCYGMIANQVSVNLYYKEN